MTKRSTHKVDRTFSEERFCGEGENGGVVKGGRMVVVKVTRMGMTEANILTETSL